MMKFNIFDLYKRCYILVVKHAQLNKFYNNNNNNKNHKN